jgi:hypothetical protein
MPVCLQTLPACFLRIPIRRFFYFLLPLLCLFSTNLKAQNEEQSSGELLENFFRDNEQASESDAQLLLERYENLRNNPLDLNRCTPEDLLDLQLFDELKVRNFFLYRQEFGPLLNAYELQAVPGWDVNDCKRLLEFAQVRTSLDQRRKPISRGFLEGDNELLVRWGRPQPFAFEGRSEGSSDAVALRYRHSFDNRLRFGFTADKDPGEAFFQKSNRQGFDFYSVHLFGQNINRQIKTLAIGDYSVRFGQGLLLQTGFAAGKSAESVAIVRGGRKLNAYSAFGEAFFYRGAAATIRLAKHWELTALYSNRRRDANLVLPDSSDLEQPEIAFTSLQTSGLHRTPSEIDDEGALREQAAAVSVAYANASLSINANFLHLRYAEPWQPQEAPYRKYAFRGSTLNGGSMDYSWRRRNWLLFGETAMSDNGAVASVNGVLFSPHRIVTLAVMNRYLPANYQSVYANPIAEVTGAANEYGTYMGADIRLLRRLQVNFYADVWRHPWLRFGVDAPSRGHEYLARVLWTKSKTFNAYVLWQSELKERNSDLEGVSGLADNRRDRLRLHSVYKVHPKMELRSRVEWTFYHADGLPKAGGFFAFQEAVVSPGRLPVSAAFRYAVFDTDNFDSRVFAYETDLFSAISIPAFSGRGTRWYLNLKWRVNKWLRLEGRVEQTDQLRAVTSAGFTGKEVFWKLQARIKW